MPAAGVIWLQNTYGSNELKPVPKYGIQSDSPKVNCCMRRGLVSEVASPQRHGSPQRFEIEPSPARRACVDQQVRKEPSQFVPIGKIAGHVLNFRDSLAIFRIVRTPQRQRLKIEILPIGVDALLADDFADMIDEPSPRPWHRRETAACPSRSCR